MDIENVVKKAVKNRENVYFIGIKGAGTSALAELLHGAGVRVSGSDTDGVFYTCAILDALKIPYFEGFDPLHIASKRPDLVIHSAAYAPETNAEMAETLRRGIPLVKYTDALGAYSAMFDSSGVAGVHGKSTTTAIAGTLLVAAGLPAKILAGSATANFGGRSTITVGDKYFVAETCEYRKHFLKFRPRRVLLTGVESDHQDFFPTYESMLGAFVEYGENIESGGELIYCADDAGARETADILRKKRNDIKYTAYGFGADGFFNIKNSASGNGESVFELSGTPVRWAVRVPGRHTVLNSAGAIALVKSIADAEGRRFDGTLVNAISRALREFSGCKRRSEIIGEAGGILFMDDYAHHPTAIKTTLAGLKDFYPGRRLVASFMAHTYSRTAAMLSDFARSFESADVVFLHRIYASAREVNDGKVSGRLLFEKTRAFHGDARYADDPLDAAGELKTVLREGDLFITLGAGDNWKLCDALFGYYSNREAAA